MHDCDCKLFNFLHKLLATTFKLRQQGKDGNMYVPLQVGVFFLPLFFSKVAFACIDGMCCNFILQVFSSVFNIKKNLLGGKSFNQSLHHDFLVVKMFSSGTVKILLVYLKNLEIEYLDLQYLDIFYSNATYVKGLQGK